MRHERLGDIIDFIRGVTFTPQDIVDAHSNGSVVCLRTKNIQEQLELHDLIAIPKKFVRREEQYIIADDLLISSANSFELVGKTVFVPHLDFSAAVGGFISIVRPKKNKIFPRYLFHWINTPFIQNKIRYCGRKTTNISNLNKELFLDLEIKYPELEEQRRIAAILDKADTIRRKRQEALKLADALVKSRFIEMFGDPVTNPMGWEMPCLEKLAASSKNALKAGPFGSSLKKEDYTEKGYKIYGQEQVIKGDAFYGDYYISEQKYNTLKSCAVSEGDVLISLVGTYGKVLIVPHGFEPGIINPRLVKISFDKKKINTVFFEHFFASDSLKTKLDSNTNGCTMGVLNLGIIKKINIPLPPIALQNQFAAFVEQTDKSKFAMQRQLEEAEASKASLMQQFFS